MGRTQRRHKTTGPARSRQDFVRDVLPVVEVWARIRFRSEELRQTAAVLAWWHWIRRPADYVPSHWAQLAVQAALAGRDLPGLGTRCTDAMRRGRCGLGGDFGGVADRSPGPEDLAESSERWATFLAARTVRAREVLELLADGLTTSEVAARLGVTPTAVGHYRRLARREA